MQNFIEEWVNDILSVYEEVDEDSVYKDLIMGYLENESFNMNEDVRAIASSFFISRFQHILHQYKGNKARAYDIHNTKRVMSDFYIMATETYRLATLSVRDMIDINCGGEFLRRIGHIEKDLKGIYYTLEKIINVVEK